MLTVDIITLFPKMFAGVFGESIIKRAIDAGLLAVALTQLREFAYDRHRQVDDTPFGGGSGMVLKPEPVFRAVRHLKARAAGDVHSVLMSPSGDTFTQATAKRLAACGHLLLICGHYEGFDQRIVDRLADEVISIGDFVLTGGELPAMIVVDAVARMLPGVLGADDSAQTDSFYDGLLEFPQYTKPRDFEGLTVPDVLLSGHHANIARWRREQSLRLTRARRPDLLPAATLSDADRRFLAALERGDFSCED